MVVRPTLLATYINLVQTHYSVISMKNQLLPVVALACVVWSSPYACAETVYERTDPEVVCLKSQMADGSTRLGSGFFVTANVLATVSHQVNKARKIKAYLADGQQAFVRLLANNPEWDVALLHAPATTLKGLRLTESSQPSLGSEVFTIGCPLELAHSLSRGVVSNARRTLEGRELIQTDLQVNAGSSGGPLLNNDGKVIGLIAGSWKGGNGLNFAVPAEYITKLASKAGIPINQADINLKIAQIRAEPVPGRRLIRLKEITDIYPDLAVALVLLGETYYELGRYPSARDALIRAVVLEPKLAFAYLDLGLVYSKGLKNVRSAQQAFQKYLLLEPNGSSAREIRDWLSKNQ